MIADNQKKETDFVQGYGAGAPELGILPGAGAQIKNQEPELSLKFGTGAGTMAISEVAMALGPFLVLTIFPN